MRHRALFGAAASVVVCVSLVFSARMTTTVNAQAGSAQPVPPRQGGATVGSSSNKTSSQTRSSDPQPIDPIADRMARPEKKSTNEPHRLAAAHPDKSVIVCVAGCPNRSEMVVYAAPVVATADPPEPPVKQAALKAEPAPAASQQAETGEVVCLAGCYGTPKSYPALPNATLRRQTAAVPASPTRSMSSDTAQKALHGTWITTVAFAEPEKAPPRPSAVRKSRRGASGEWFTRRFSR
jgi:hypothetical protein